MLIEFPFYLAALPRAYFIFSISFPSLETKRLINDTRTRNVRSIAGYALYAGKIPAPRRFTRIASAVVEDYDGPRAVFSYARIIGMHDVPSGRSSQCVLHSSCTIIEAYQFRFAPSESCTGATQIMKSTLEIRTREKRTLPVSA